MGGASKRRNKSSTAKSTSASEKLSYSSYLKVDELISLQAPVAQPQVHDEMLFIVIHQTYELWFKQVLFELEALIAHVEADELLPAMQLLSRIGEILKVLVQQVDVLETMTPTEFNRFRSNLQPASGFQSQQFRELEILAGIPQAEYTKFFALQPEWKDAVTARLKRPSLREALVSLLKRRKLASGSEPGDIVTAFHKIYENGRWLELRAFCEGLIRFDELFGLWRFRHVQMVERMIGMKPGTGGSLGAAYLQGTLKKRFFPELWESRTQLGTY